MQIIFVCTGNTCRSPLAEAIANRIIDESGIEELTAGSAGTFARTNDSASVNSIYVGRENGLDISSHRSRLFIPSMINKGDLVLTMGKSHRNRIIEMGVDPAQIFILSQFASGNLASPDVDDPFGGDIHDYRHTFSVLENLISAAMDRIAAKKWNDNSTER